MDHIDLCNEVEEADFECEVLVRAKFHFRESDKMGRVTIAWVEQEMLEDLVGPTMRERTMKKYLDNIYYKLAGLPPRPARQSQMEESHSEEETQQP